MRSCVNLLKSTFFLKPFFNQKFLFIIIDSTMNSLDTNFFVFVKRSLGKLYKDDSSVCSCIEKDIKTYAHAYFDAFRLPVKSGDNSARSLMSVFTLSASPVKEMN